ncbi:hypothetical protein PFISCL1PPCAC_28413, partial [Pristionchus fissidentatus]
HESQSDGHEHEDIGEMTTCASASLIRIDEDAPIRRRSDPKTTPKCFLCEKYPKTVSGYIQHLQKHHRTSLVKPGFDSLS